MAIPSWLTWGLVTAIASAVSGIVGFFMGIRKWRLEKRKLLLEIRGKGQSVREQEYKGKAEALAQVLLVCTDYAKQRQGTKNLVFDESGLRDFLGPHADMVYATLVC